jgi:hypothetical protein
MWLLGRSIPDHKAMQIFARITELRHSRFALVIRRMTVFLNLIGGSTD